MISTYLSTDCLNDSLSHLLIVKPYQQGLNNIKYYFKSRVIDNYLYLEDDELINNKQKALLKNRIKHFVVGLILLIPVINSLAIYILWKIDKKTREEAATKIQTNVRGWLARKKLKLIKKEIKAALTIQTAYKKWIKRKQELKKSLAITSHPVQEAEKLGEAPGGYLQKLAKGLINAKMIRDLSSSLTGVNMEQVTSFLQCSKASLSALSRGKKKIGATLAMQALGHGLNATVKLFVPPEVLKMDKLTNPAHYT